MTWATGTAYSFNYRYAAMNAQAGATYAASAYVRAASDSARNKDIEIVIREIDSNHIIVAEGKLRRLHMRESFTEISAMLTVQNTGDHLGIYILQNNAEPGDAFEVDMASMIQTSRAPNNASQAAPIPCPTPTPTPLGGGQVVNYYPTPGDTADTTYTLQAGGKPVAVVHYLDVAYARFAFSGTVNLTVGSSQPISSYSISPRSYGIVAAASGSGLSFSLWRPSNLIVTVNNLEKLFIFADPLETNAPPAVGPSIVNLSRYVTDTTGVSIQTAQIQAAINDTSSLNAGTGGLLYVPNGNYLTGTLQLKDNVAMYLQSGARLQGSGNPKDYSGALITTGGASNVKLFGRGVVDENGTTLRPAGAAVNILQPSDGQNLEVDDLLLRNSASWTVHIVRMNHVTITNVKIINDQSLTNGDGIDPDASTNVTINRPFIYTTDDCFAVKTTSSGGRPSSQILVDNAVCWTKKSALKVGTETTQDISNVTFANDNVVHADRVMSLYMADGSTMHDIAYFNDFSETVGGDRTQALIDFEDQTVRGSTTGHITTVTVTNYVAYNFSPRPSIISGYSSTNPISGLTFNNLVIAGTRRLSAAEAQINIANASGVAFNP